MDAGVRIGIDLGGTKIEGLALDAGGRELSRVRVPTPQGDYDATLAAIAKVISVVERDAGMRGTLGLATPGAPSRVTGLMKNCNSTWLNGRPLRADLERVLARPIRIANDADCLALSEATDGAGAGAGTVFAVILGTGVGGGIVVNGSLVAGPNAIAGEWGHNPLPWPGETELPGRPCYCGRMGCIETWVSGPGLEWDHRTVTGARLGGGEIAARAGAEPECAATMARYESRLARALASVINVLDPDVVVLGGGVSRVARLYESVPRLWGEFVFSDAVATRLVPAAHGDSSGVRGAAWLWEGELHVQKHQDPGQLRTAGDRG